MPQSISAGVSASAQEEGAVSASVSSAYSAGSQSDARVIGSSASERSAYVRDRVRVLARKEKSTANRHAELISHFGYSASPVGLRAKAHSITPASKDKQMNGNKKKDPSAGDLWVSLPDSTRETGLVNPPDMGTTSPIEWNTGLSFGLPDFNDRTFLNPTLHVGERSKKQLTADKIHRALKGSILRSNPSPLVTSPLNETQPNDLSHQSGLHSSILDPLGQQ
jgi:hypothetical protein